MIFTERSITVRKGESTINEPVILYRGDYDVEVRFTIKNSKFIFLSQTNLIESEKAAYAQLAIIKPDGDNVFSDIAKCEEGTVAFVLTSDMIDELHDVGLYSFQIRLYDQDKQSRASIPPVEYGIEIREPIASEDHINSVDEALVGYSIAKTTSLDNEPVGPTFDDEGNYNVTDWETGDRITEGKLNKIEDALNSLNQNEQTLDKKIINNYNVLNATKAEKNELLVERQRIDNLAKLPAGSTAGDAELMDIRVDIGGVIHDTAGKAVRSQVNRALKSTNDIINEIGEKIFEDEEFDMIEENMVYSAVFPNGTPLPFSCSFKKNVSPGEVYRLSSTTFANVDYALAYLYDATGALKYFIERNTEAVETPHYDYEFVVPDGIYSMIVSSPSSAASMVKISKEKIELSFDVNTINEMKNVNDNVENIQNDISDMYEMLNEFKDGLCEKIFEDEEFDMIEENMVYSAVFPNGTALPSSCSFKKNVSPGEVYRLSSTTFANVDYALAYLYDKNGVLTEYVAKNTEAVETPHYDYEFVVPDGIYSMIVSTHINNKDMVRLYKEQYVINYDIAELLDMGERINLIDEQLDSISTRENVFIEVSFDEIEQNKVYSEAFPNGATLNYTRSYKKNVSPGEVYRLSSATFANVSYALAYLYDKNGLLKHFIAKNTEDAIKTYYDYEFIIPDDVCLMVVSVPNAYYDIVKLTRPEEKITLSISGPIGYEFKDGVLNISYKMGQDTDFVVELKEKGGNNIFDFYSEGEIYNPLKYPSKDFQNKTELISHTTDWHCPYIVSAKNNQDGDNKKDGGTFNYYFTGGNHQYNNQGSGSTPTGRTTSIRVFIDGREIHYESGYAMNNIEVRWANLVQGYNTTKSDGSGREILQENHTLIFDGRVFHSSVEIIPLEDISMERWYGLQCVRGNTFGSSSTQFIGGTNRQVMTSDLSSANCGSGKASTMIHKGSKYGLKMTLDTTYDVGSMESYPSPFAFNSGDKSYFNLTNGINMTAGDRYYIRGTYEFFVI